MGPEDTHSGRGGGAGVGHDAREDCCLKLAAPIGPWPLTLVPPMNLFPWWVVVALACCHLMPFLCCLQRATPVGLPPFGGVPAGAPPRRRKKQATSATPPPCAPPVETRSGSHTNGCAHTCTWMGCRDHHTGLWSLCFGVAQ